MSKTIMLVHGAWVTIDCWSSFRDFFEAKGYRVVVPEWPYLDRPVEELRRNPDPRLAKMTIKGLVDHFVKQIRDLPEQPVLIGHSFGGLIVQMLLDRGLGAAGVAIATRRTAERYRDWIRASGPPDVAWLEPHCVDVV